MKLQIHQHSLFTSKVFSWHSSSTQVFITGSSSKLDHHQSWIIIKVGSYSKLDHNWIIIIITAPDILRKWCYLSILLIIGSSIEPTLFHASCRPSLHVGLFQHLYLTLSQNDPPNTYIWSCRNQSNSNIRKACPTLTSNHVGTHPTTLSKRPITHIWQLMLERTNTYIRPSEEPILPTCRKGSALISDHVGTNPIIILERHAQHSHLTMWELIPQPCQKGLALTYDHERNQSSIHVKRALHLHLTMRGTNPTFMSKGIYTYI